VITITCDKCDRPFETDDDAVGEKVQCPYCGDVNRVPRANAPSVVGRVPAPAKEKSDNQPETTIAIVRQAMFRAHPFWYTLMVLLGVGGVVLAIAAKTTAVLADKPWLLWVGLGLLAAALLWWFGWWIAPHRWIKLTITSKRTIRQEGIVVRKTSEVLHNHIRNVKIEQSVLERLLGVGTIAIDSAGGEQEQMIEIEMKHVPQPYKVKEIIDRFRRM
jgi:membrane protein YdbS with pleckstrin-like domain